MKSKGGATAIRVVDTPTTERTNDFYQGNRAPLTPNPLIKLPVGDVQPKGWIRHQLELMADGFTGNLNEGISKWCEIEGNAWADPKGQGDHGWEEVPYWLRGYIELGYILDDKKIIQDAEEWVKGTLAGQRDDGYLGPRANWEEAQIRHTTAHDIWPTVVMLYVLQSYYDATGDEQVLKAMKDYYRWIDTVPLEYFLSGTWQHWRGGDNLASIHWLYNQTGEDWLLDLGIVNHDQTANWAGKIPTWHGVNLSQGFREPAQFFQQFQDKRYLEATYRNYEEIMRKYGQVPGGMFGADENAREGYDGPRQAAETCSMVEFMHSDEMLVSITGDIKWADHAEEVAFNSLPASMTPDLKGLHYLTAPNMVQLDRESKKPMLQNGGNMLAYNPHRFRCCQHNVSFGWPYYAGRLWMATRGNGLAAVFYGESEVTATVGNGVEVKFTESTNYPFDGTVKMALESEKNVTFPLHLRIPNWAENAEIRINGKKADVNPEPSKWVMIEREWSNNDQVELILSMKLDVTVWEENLNSVSVNRGPLTYSLKIEERWERYGGTDEFPAYEVFPESPWNYGLVVDPDNPGKSIKVDEVKRDIPDQPFTLENAPIRLTAQARRIPNWKLEDNGLIEELQQSPVASEEPTEEVTLVPMGCARLRVSAFPHIGEGSGANRWEQK